MSPTAQLPIRFFSFTHNDNDSLSGKLEALRDRLEQVIWTHTGLADFQLFIDKDRENGIAWGQKWAERIKEALHQSVFLIPIVSPAYLNRPWCREELIEFLKIEEKLPGVWQEFLSSGSGSISGTFKNPISIRVTQSSMTGCR